MSATSLHQNIRTIANRYQRHLESGDHVLREGSQQEIAHGIVDYFHENDPDTGKVHTDGHIVAPGGIGKTISAADFIIGINTMPKGDYVLGNETLGKRVLITVPSNQLVDQWGDRLLGDRNEDGSRKPSLFGDRFSEANVGIYHAGMSDEEIQSVLSKPVVIMTHDSARALHEHHDSKTRKPAPLIRPQDFAAVLIDEVDDKPRGDVTGKFYKDVFFPECLVMGMTATPLFRSGKTIGDYLFGGKKPICEIVHKEAVERKEIAPHINIIVRPEIDSSSIIKPKTNGWDDYSNAEQMKLIEQTGIDNALLEVIKTGRHPKTGKPLKDMMQLHQAVSIEHGIHIAEQLNKTFGKGYAEVVWGDMDKEAHDLVQKAFKDGRLRAVVQCKVWGRGTDFPPLEMTVQHAPSLSPGKVVQFHTRASRKDDGKKSAIYLSPYIDGIDQLVVGEVLGGLYMIPDGFEFPPTAGKKNNPPAEPEPWPDIKGVKVYHTERQLEMFANELKQKRHVNGLPAKANNMLTLDEMAATLRIDPGILDERVYTPLKEAYEKKGAREKFIDISSADKQEDVLHVRGRLFPEWRIGNFRHRGQEAFCIDQNLIPLCEHTLYGRLDKVPPEMLGKKDVQRLLGGNDAQTDELWKKLQHAFFHRKPYERNADIDGITFSLNSFGFNRNRNGDSEFFISPDALIPAYRVATGADKPQAQQWAKQPFIRQYKTSEWLTEANVMEALELIPVGNGDAAFVHQLFDRLKSQSRGMRAGEEGIAELGRGRQKQSVAIAKRWLSLADSSDQTALCIHKDALEWIKQELGYESAYEFSNNSRKRSV